MKKIVYAIISIIFVLGCSFLVKFNSPVTIYIGNYEVITDLNFLLLLSVVAVLLILNLTGSYYIIRSTNKNKFLNKNKKIRTVYEKYINLITRGFLSDMNGDLDEAEKNEKQAGKTLKSHDLTKILEIKILLKKQKYEQAVAIVRTIRTDDNDYLVNSILLAQALKRQNAQDIELYCKKILEHKKDDKIAITNLYKVYKSNLDWSECKKLLKTIRKYKTLDKMNLKIEDKIVENNLEQQVNTELS